MHSWLISFLFLKLHKYLKQTPLLFYFILFFWEKSSYFNLCYVLIVSELKNNFQIKICIETHVKHVSAIYHTRLFYTYTQQPKQCSMSGDYRFFIVVRENNL